MGAKESYLETLTQDPKKTTVAPYSLRGRPEPTVAAPRTWAELTAPGLAHLTYQEVLERVAAGIDPLASLLTPPVPALAPAVGGGMRRRDRRGAARPAAVGAGRRSEGGTTTHHRGPESKDAQATVHRWLRSGRRGRFAAGRSGRAGPVELELARAEQSVPGPHAMAGGSLYELKWDGHLH